MLIKEQKFMREIDLKFCKPNQINFILKQNIYIKSQFASKLIRTKEQGKQLRVLGKFCYWLDSNMDLFYKYNPNMTSF